MDVSNAKQREVINDINEGDKKMKKMGIYSTEGQRIIFIEVKRHKVVMQKWLWKTKLRDFRIGYNKKNVAVLPQNDLVGKCRVDNMVLIVIFGSWSYK